LRAVSRSQSPTSPCLTARERWHTCRIHSHARTLAFPHAYSLFDRSFATSALVRLRSPLIGLLRAPCSPSSQQTFCAQLTGASGAACPGPSLGSLCSHPAAPRAGVPFACPGSASHANHLLPAMPTDDAQEIQGPDLAHVGPGSGQHPPLHVRPCCSPGQSVSTRANLLLLSVSHHSHAQHCSPPQHLPSVLDACPALPSTPLLPAACSTVVGPCRAWRALMEVPSWGTLPLVGACLQAHAEAENTHPMTGCQHHMPSYW
jgi:hypothetical protein